MSSISSERADHRRPDDATPPGRRGLRQRIPYRMFGKRLDSTKRLVVSSKVWMKTIPTQNCDVLLTFPAKADDATLMWLLARLKTRTPQIIVHVRHHSNSGIYGFYMTATYENLLKGTEELGIKKPLKMDYGGGMKEFTFEDQDCFAGVEDEKTFLTSQERQDILYHLLCELRAVEGEQLAKIRFLEGQPIVPRLESGKVISQVFPLHNKDDLAELRKCWVQAFFRKQPQQKICEYFGVKIALYFAYLGHYTASLCFPTLLGMVFWFIQDSQEIEDICFVTYALFNVIWATLYLEHWKRTSSELAYKWGTLEKKDELIKDPRPLYKGDLVKSPVTGRMQPFYPPWKRNLFRYLVSFPVIGFCLFVVFAVMLLIFQLQEWVNALIASDDIPAFLRFCPKILLALCITIFDELYRVIAVWLNDKENYRLEETYENQLILKLVMFQFVNSFLSLFYIAFYLRDMDRLREQLAALLITRQVIGNLKEALLPYLVWKARLLKVGLQITGQMSPSSLDKEIKEMTSGVRQRRRGQVGEDTETVDNSPEQEQVETEPSPGDVGEESLQQCLANNILHKEKQEDPVIETTQSPLGEKMSGPTLTQAEVESAMKKYEDTYEDYLEMFIQFGYVTLFSSAFPLAALCALLNNVIEIRSDAFKLCVNHQRPFGKQVENIGIWQDALEVMGVIAVIVNCALIGMSGLTHRMMPNMDDTTTIIIIIVLEHLILLLKFSIAFAIPDIPDWVALEMAKVEFQRREALKRLEAQTSPGLNSPDIRRRCPSENLSDSPRQSRPPDSPRNSNLVPSTLPGLRPCPQAAPQPPHRGSLAQGAGRGTSSPPHSHCPSIPSRSPIVRSPDHRGQVSSSQKRQHPSTDPWSQAQGEGEVQGYSSELRGHLGGRSVPRSQSSSSIQMSNSPPGGVRCRSVPKSPPEAVSESLNKPSHQSKEGLERSCDGSSVDIQRHASQSSNRMESVRGTTRKSSDSQFHLSSYRSEQMMNAQNSDARRIVTRRTSDSHILSQSSSISSQSPDHNPHLSSRSESPEIIPELGNSFRSERDFMTVIPGGSVIQRRPQAAASDSQSRNDASSS
ncbi:anoctamin-8-like [Haliotis rubra]|uniref:anoctamin-8-like n=1 Tax=Haliotis rubra TaxID=36100 RepID=UPI001EE5E386|nr:anoctamin-8-like [Haliotis rubra]